MKSPDERLVAIGAKLKVLIKKKHSNMEHFAYDIGISRITLQKTLNGHNFQMNTLLKILDGLDMDMKTFFKELDSI